MSQRTFVIAEAAACHDGDIRKAFRLVNLARDVGADAVKFQWVSSPTRLAARRNAVEYLGAYQNLAFPAEWLEKLRTYCGERGVEFMCTVYLPEDIRTVAPYLTRFKVASFEAGDLHFVKLHAEFGKQVIVSAGMARHPRTIFESYYKVLNLDRGFTHFQHMAVLYCVSAYPCPADQLNLAMLRPNFTQDGHYDGLSDHTKDPLTGALAVAAGGRIVEFHVRLDETLPSNADYAVARTASEAAEYVANIRRAEVLMGDSQYLRVADAEQSYVRYQVHQ